MAFKKYENIISVLVEHKDVDGLCRISQKEIAYKTSTSQSLVSKSLIRLETYDKCIEKVAPGVYRLNHENLLEYGPISKALKYYAAISKNNSIIKLRYDEQAKLLGMTTEEITMVWGYLGNP